MKWFWKFNKNWFSVRISTQVGNFHSNVKWILTDLNKTRFLLDVFRSFQLVAISSRRLPFAIISMIGRVENDWNMCFRWLDFAMLYFPSPSMLTIVTTSFYSFIWRLVVRALTSFFFNLFENLLCFAFLCFALFFFLPLKSSSPRWITIDHTCSLKMISNSTGFNVSMSTRIANFRWLWIMIRYYLLESGSWNLRLHFFYRSFRCLSFFGYVMLPLLWLLFEFWTLELFLFFFLFSFVFFTKTVCCSLKFHC